MYLMVQHGLAGEACDTFALVSDHKNFLRVDLIDYY
jgi:hypothetical protein